MQNMARIWSLAVEHWAILCIPNLGCLFRPTEHPWKGPTPNFDVFKHCFRPLGMTLIGGVQFELNWTLLQLFARGEFRCIKTTWSTIQIRWLSEMEIKGWSTSWGWEGLINIRLIHSVIKYQQSVSFSLAIFGVTSPTNAHTMTICGSQNSSQTGSLVWIIKSNPFLERKLLQSQSLLTLSR